MNDWFKEAPKPPLPTRRWLSPDEAADYLGVSRRHFDHAVRKGLIAPSRSLGKRTPRYGTHELDKLMGYFEPEPPEEEVVIKTPYLIEKQAAAYCRTSAKAMHDRAVSGEVQAIEGVDAEDGYLFLKEHLDEFLANRLTSKPG